MEPNYSQQYKDPRWQNKRLEILERDGWKCSLCDSEDQELHVHHRFYIKGKEIWDYKNDVLITLCKKCHKNEHKSDEQLMTEFLYLRRKELKLVARVRKINKFEIIKLTLKVLSKIQKQRAIIYKRLKLHEI